MRRERMLKFALVLSLVGLLGLSMLAYFMGPEHIDPPFPLSIGPQPRKTFGFVDATTFGRWSAGGNRERGDAFLSRRALAIKRWWC